MNHLKNKLKSRWYGMKMVFSVPRGLDEMKEQIDGWIDG